jgi:MtN3 and saliva related transmembrane protein
MRSRSARRFYKRAARCFGPAFFRFSRFSLCPGNHSASLLKVTLVLQGMPQFPFYIGLAAGILTSVAALPQLIKLIREKRAGDISLAMFFVLLGGLGLWVWYGVLKDDLPLIITNAISFAINAAVVVMSLWYKRRS